MLNNVQAKQLRQLPVVRDEKDKDPPKTRAKTDRWMKSDGWTPIAHVESYLPPSFWPYFSPQRAGPTGAERHDLPKETANQLSCQRFHLYDFITTIYDFITTR
jgi:hypothetical protein